MEKILRRVESIEQQRAETYRYWHSVDSSERMRATWELSFDAYKMKGLAHDGQRLQRTVVRIQRPSR